MFLVGDLPLPAAVAAWRARNPAATVEADPPTRLVKVKTTASQAAIQRVLEEAGFAAALN